MWWQMEMASIVVMTSPVVAQGPKREVSVAGHSEHAPGKIRTCDLSLRRRALYPLSYGRNERLRRALLGFELSRKRAA